MKKVKWAIMGVGDISHKFAESFKSISDGYIYGVASRDKNKAESFAKLYGIPNAYGSYEEMLKDSHFDY